MKITKRQVRSTFALHGELSESAPAAAAKLCLNTNSFINKCVEGCLEAAACDDMAVDIPIVRLMRRGAGKPYLEASRILEICLLRTPASMASSQLHCHAFVRLVEEHAEPLTPEIVELFWRLAQTRVQRQNQFEKKLTELQTRGAS
jgi:hypothetical protein